MFIFTLQIILLLSLGLMVYIVARKIPVISDNVDEIESHNSVSSKIESLINSIPLDKIDFVLSQFLEKTLRKTKLLLMKLDNYLNHHLEKFKNVKQATNLQKEKKLALFEKLTEDNNIQEEASEEKTEDIYVKPEGEEEADNSDIII